MSTLSSPISYPHLKWTSEDVKKFWDWRGQIEDDYFSFMHGQSLIRVLEGQYIHRGQEILDYGSGPGFLLKHLLSAGYSVFGSDFSDASVRSLDQRFKGKYPTYLGSSSLDELAASGRRFDTIFLLEVVEHLYDDMLNSTFQTLRSLLKPGGQVIISTPNNERLEKSEVLCPRCDHVFHIWQHVRSWTKESFKKYLSDAGFATQGVLELNLPRMTQWGKISPLVDKLLSLKQGGARAVPPNLIFVASTRT